MIYCLYSASSYQRSSHLTYLESGADIIETNTFSGTTIAMADYEMEHLVYELNYESAKIAKEAADFYSKQHLINLVLLKVYRTYNKTASMSSDVNDPGFRAVTFEELKVAYKLQCEALLDGGDIL